jgi:hypothetical protein
MQKVGWFKDIVTFWQIWSTIPISHLEKFFFDPSTQNLPIYKVGEKEIEKRISSLGIFQSGVKPMWEDEVNKDCVEIRAKIPAHLTQSMINAVWEHTVVDLITTKIPSSDDIAGIRICDKSRGGDSLIRIEIWTKIRADNDPRLEGMKTHIKQLFEGHGFMGEIQIANRK